MPTPVGLRGQKDQIQVPDFKYKKHLKNVSGLTVVLLVNKEEWSSLPVVVPVLPPEDLFPNPLAVSTPPPLPKPALT